MRRARNPELPGLTRPAGISILPLGVGISLLTFSGSRTEDSTGADRHAALPAIVPLRMESERS